MSERENIQLVRQGYDAFGRGDIPGLLALFDSNITWQTSGPAELPTAGQRRGHQQVQGFFEAIASVGEIQRFEPREFFAEGDRVVVVGDEETRVKATGKTVEMRWVHIFTVRNGKVLSFEERADVSALVAEVRAGHAGV